MDLKTLKADAFELMTSDFYDREGLENLASCYIDDEDLFRLTHEQIANAILQEADQTDCLEIIYAEC